MKTNRIIMTLASIGLATAAQAATWTVGPTAAYDYMLIQDAIAASSTGDQIEVYPNTYNENLDLLGKDLVIYSNGGLGSVTVDGTSSGPVISCVSGETSATQIKGLIFIHGNAALGGGMLIDGSSPMVKECRFEDNQATIAGGGAALKNSNSMFELCSFVDNNAFQAGGHMHIEGGKPSVLDTEMLRGHAGVSPIVGYGGSLNAKNTDLFMARCHIEDNSSTRAGGSISLKRSIAHIEQSSVYSGTSTDGGGLFCIDTNLRLLGVVFKDNVASNDGGGLYTTGTGDVFVEQCHLVSNESHRNGAGMFVRMKRGRHEVIQSVFEQNFAGYSGAGTFYYHADRGLIDNSQYLGNIAQNGGGIFSRSPRMLRIMNSGFDSNQAQVDGGALYVYRGQAGLDNCQMFGNLAGDDGGGIKLERARGYGRQLTLAHNHATRDGGGLYVTGGSFSGMSRSRFEGNTAGLDGGAIRNEMSSTVFIRQCDVVYNEAYGGTLAGGLMTDGSSASTISNSLFCGNIATNITGAFTDLGGNTISASCP